MFLLEGSLLAAVLSEGCVIPPKRFLVHQVSSGIFIGTQPTKEKDFEILRTNGIRTVVSLQSLPWNVRNTRHMADARGMNFRHIPIPAWPLEPSERRVREAVLTLKDKSLQPMFVHCYLGHDRAALVVGLYRIYYENWTPDEAWAEALRNGFKLNWALHGLRSYFWCHCQKPDWCRAPPQMAKP
jgi:protein-tyrosine phosphatase